MPKLINTNISVALSQKNIHYKIIKLIILKLLLSATPLLAHYELPREIDLMMIEHDLNKCSKGKIDSYFFHKENDLSMQAHSLPAKPKEGISSSD